MVIVNSTPILGLQGIGRLELLQEVFGEITIPEAVRREVTVKNAHILDDYVWIHIAQITNHSMKESFTSALHDGEVEVIILAKEHNAKLVILDDKLARQHARYLGLDVIGTVGVLLRAKRMGIISEVRPLLDSLIQTDFYLSDAIYSEALRLSEE
ncbi:MAG: DUF3368 domain-containing protein [Oscillospiraceae bacterium]|nr:DUF3368 domain-containing protein [Oscillospiraceae bacterium]